MYFLSKHREEPASFSRRAGEERINLLLLSVVIWWSLLKKGCIKVLQPRNEWRTPADTAVLPGKTTNREERETATKDKAGTR